MVIIMSGVIMRVINKICTSAHFVKYSYDYRPNWTPLSPITITYELQQRLSISPLSPPSFLTQIFSTSLNGDTVFKIIFMGTLFFTPCCIGWTFKRNSYFTAIYRRLIVPEKKCIHVLNATKVLSQLKK